MKGGMNMKEIYNYPVLIRYDESDKCYTFDLPGLPINGTYGETCDEAIIAAQEIIGGLIVGYEEENLEIPAPLSLDDITAAPGERLIYVNVWMPYHRAETRNAYQRKNVTVPAWLNMLAEKKNINFSLLLSNALKSELGLN